MRLEDDEADIQLLYEDTNPNDEYVFDEPTISNQSFELLEDNAESFNTDCSDATSEKKRTNTEIKKI